MKKYEKTDLGKKIETFREMSANYKGFIEGATWVAEIMGDIGKKDDSSKLRMDLIPPEIIEELAKVITYGAKKYGDNNWQKVGIDRYYAALLRHLIEWRKGNKIDKESKLNHLSHVLTNAAFMIYLDK